MINIKWDFVWKLTHGSTHFKSPHIMFCLNIVTFMLCYVMLCYVMLWAGISHSAKWLSKESTSGVWIRKIGIEFHLVTTSMPSQGPTQSHIQWVPGVKLTTQSHLVPRLRTRGAVLPLPQYVFMAWCSVKCRGYGTFTFVSVALSFSPRSFGRLCRSVTRLQIL